MMQWPVSVMMGVPSVMMRPFPAPVVTSVPGMMMVPMPLMVMMPVLTMMMMVVVMPLVAAERVGLHQGVQIDGACPARRAATRSSSICMISGSKPK